MAYSIETGEFGREQGPLGTSAWCILRDPQGEIVSYSVGDDEQDALNDAAEMAGVLVVETKYPLAKLKGNQL